MIRTVIIASVLAVSVSLPARTSFAQPEIVGDSIAAQTQKYLPPYWLKLGHSGDTSSQVSKRMRPASVVVISAGTNDRKQHFTVAQTYAVLAAMRSRVEGHAIWILSTRPAPRFATQQVAKKYGDAVISFRAGPDHIHPANPKNVARAVAITVARMKR